MPTRCRAKDTQAGARANIARIRTNRRFECGFRASLVCQLIECSPEAVLQCRIRRREFQSSTKPSRSISPVANIHGLPPPDVVGFGTFKQ